MTELGDQLEEVVEPKLRLDKYLVANYPDKTRSAWAKQIVAGLVLVKGQQVKPATTDFDPTDISFKEPEPIETIELTTIYQDDDVIVIDKPIGVLTHPTPSSHEPSIAESLKKHITGFNQDDNRAGIVHRLDRDTSGLMIVAKHPSAAESLKQQFKSRDVAKVYRARLTGVADEARYEIEAPLTRSNRHDGKFVVQASGKEAITAIDVLRQHETYFEASVRIETGRTHQIRVHSQYIKHHVVGDRLYGNKQDKNQERMYLHAEQLKLELPSGEAKTFISPTPWSSE